MIFLGAFKEMWTVRNMLSPWKLLHEGVIHCKDVPAFCLPLFTWLSTSSPGRPSFFIPKSGPTDFQCVLWDVSLLLWATSKEEEEDSEEKTVWSANGSMLLPVSQSNELLSTITHRSRAVRVLLPCSTCRNLLGTPAVPDLSFTCDAGLRPRVLGYDPQQTLQRSWVQFSVPTREFTTDCNSSFWRSSPTLASPCTRHYMYYMHTWRQSTQIQKNLLKTIKIFYSVIYILHIKAKNPLEKNSSINYWHQ